MTFGIRKKLFTVFLAGLLALAAIGYLFFADNPLASMPHRDRAPGVAALRTTGLLRSALRNVEGAELAYALSGEAGHLAACREAEASLRSAFGELGRSFPAAEGGQTAGALGALIERRAQFTDEVIAARAGGGRRAAYELVQSDAGRRLSGEIDAGLTGLEQDELRSGDDRDRALERSIRKGLSLIATGYGAALALVLLSIVIIGGELARSRRTTRDLQELKERFQLFTEGLQDSAIMMLGPDGSVTSWSAAAERLQGYGERDIVGEHYSLLFPDEDRRLGKPEHCLRTAEIEGRHEQICTAVRRDGSVFQVHSVITPLRDSRGGLRGFSVVLRDVTERRRAEDLLKKLALTVEQAADLVVITDRAGRVEYVNKAVEEVTGFTRDEFTAGGLALLQAERQDPRLYREMWDTALGGRTFQAEATYVRKGGEPIYLDAVMTPIKAAEGAVTHVVFTGSDLTPVKLMRDKLAYLVSYDALTGLPNRDLFADRLARELADAGSGTLAVLAIDIDRFKYLNEIYGLDAGNKVLKQVAESLSVSVSKGDTVGRLGSDEFGIVLRDIGRPADVALFVKMIMKNVPQIIMSGGEELPATLAVGIAVYPADGADARTLMKNADTALSKAKDLGRNRYQFYTPDMNVGISELVFMERRLSDALRNKEYSLCFQPYYNLSSKKVAGAEALVRWKNDEFGHVSPTKFIPMLEETGMIIDVGRWVLRIACRQLREWTNGRPHIPVSVNLSASQFRHEYLVETVESTIREHGVDPRRLTLEITESTFMKDQDFAIAVLRRLKGIGVSISIDDFGTGYSSLSYLKRFPVDMIKIDQSFVKDVATDPDTTSLVSSIIAMAHGLNLRTIAEGVESEEQWKILRLLKCDMGQGFYCSPAVPPQEFEKLLA